MTKAITDTIDEAMLLVEVMIAGPDLGAGEKAALALVLAAARAQPADVALAGVSAEKLRRIRDSAFRAVDDVDRLGTPFSRPIVYCAVGPIIGEFDREKAGQLMAKALKSAIEGAAAGGRARSAAPRPGCNCPVCVAMGTT